jgi:hypothetical protein
LPKVRKKQFAPLSGRVEREYPRQRKRQADLRASGDTTGIKAGDRMKLQAKK